MSRDRTRSANPEGQPLKRPSLPARMAGGVIGFAGMLIDLAVLLFFLLLFAFGAYSLYDTNKIYVDASSLKYQTFKPVTEDEKGFDELVRENPDVIGWINVYGTNIDYPLLFSTEFDKYINADPEGNFSLSGSIFLDHQNSGDFSDFKTIIYGHHMEKHQMFGDIDQYRKETYFHQHKYGDLYFNHKHHGVDYFAYVEGDAYDASLYNVHLTTEEEKQAFLDYVKEKAHYYRETGVTTEDHLVVLSTCAGDTNGRYLLIGKLSDETFKDPFPKEEETGISLFLPGTDKPFWEELPDWWWYLLKAGGVILFLFLIWVLIRRRRRKNY